MLGMTTLRFPFALLVSALLVSACDTTPAPSAYDAADEAYAPPDVRDRFIVVLDESELAGKTRLEVVETVIDEHGVTPIFRYDAALAGFAARLTAAAVADLEADPRVDYVEPDGIVGLEPIRADTIGTGEGGPYGVEDPAAAAIQKTPWGVERVGGGVVYTGSNRAWVLDSGIDLDHPDLNVDVARSRSFLTGRQASNPDDQNGHGTHVAGTIAAIDDKGGVIGVAAGAPVVSVRVLDKSGWGTNSGVIAGVNYVAANAAPGDVANMSLGGGRSRAVNQAVKAAASNLVRFTLAAGNSARDAAKYSPASANGEGIYTVSAFAEGDVLAWFSNFGNPPVDVSAPGVRIRSTYKGGRYAILNGTSMAAPHVAGLILIGGLNLDGYVTGDPDGMPDPIVVH